MAFATINSSTPKSIPAIEDAFAAEPSLKKRVYDAIGTTPQYIPLFEDIARYTSSLLARNTNPIIPQPVQAAAAVPDGPAAKKRKLEKGDAATGNTQTPGDVKADLPLQFYMPDVSFAIPQRKKLTLEFTAGRGFLRARNQTSKEVEFGVAWDKIQHVLCLPVPEKNQRQTNFCIIPQYGDGINPPHNGDPAPESIVWTVADGPPKAGAFTGNGQQIATTEGETAEQLVRKTLNENLSQTQVVRPDEREFVSAMPEAHRKGEKAYHVKAFRGSKEGYLFLLSTGILFGFKKPLLFFAFETIDSISYTSVLQRTFNLNVMARPLASEETQEFEFSMIDQADFSGIDAYIKKHGLQDASLAEARRAKRYNINGVKTEDGNTTTTGEGVAGEGEEEESELQKAQRELEDQEDEDEEDYDPGSDSDSDGSGSSSDDEDSEDGEGRADNEDDDDDGDGDRDLVADELGSQAEDIPDDQL